MHKPAIKLGLIVCLVACGVFSDGVVTLTTTRNPQIKLFDENSDPCSTNPCRNGGICTVNNADYTCNCKTPYSGERCEIHPCHSSPCLNEGACIEVENTYGCVCSEPFHGEHCENDPCSYSPCKNGGTCHVAGIDFTCSCIPSHFGKQCEMTHESTTTENEVSTISYECDCGPNSTGCHMDNGTKVCHCKSGYAKGDDEMCQACDCGEQSYDCNFKNGRKKCYCNLFHAELNGKCVECNCDNNGICEFENGVKICSCYSYQRYFQGKCKYCYCGNFANDCGFFDDGKVNCDCQEEYIQRNDFCVDINSTLNETTTKDYFTTGITEDECNCGENSVSCSLDWRGGKVCKCKNNYAQKNGTCAATCSFWDRKCFNGGQCRQEDTGYFCQCIGTFVGDRCEIDVCDPVRYKCYSMRAECRRKGQTAVCECPVGTTYSWSSDTCEEICDDRTCLHGVCEVRGNNSYICICYEGYYGLHCEIPSRIVSYTIPYGILLIVSVGIVIFAIASIIAVQWVKKLRKQVEEGAKEIRNP